MLRRRHILAYAAMNYLALAGRTPCVQADEKQASAPWLEAIASQVRDEFGVPAVWIAASARGRLEHAVVGVKKQGERAPALVTDRLMIASTTKPMTGIWLASLVERGKLRYDSRMIDVVPELATTCLPEHRSITLGDLLSHTSGLVTGDINLDGKRPERFQEERLRLARLVVAIPSKPNTKGRFSYSNMGVTIAGIMGEKVSGIPFNQAITEFYRDRVGLQSWGTGHPNLKGDLSEPWPHMMVGDGVRLHHPDNQQFHGAFPSGGAHCNILDLARFGQLASRGFRGGSEVLQPVTWKTVLSKVPGTEFATLSAFKRLGGNVPIFLHQGGIGGHSTELWLSPTTDLVFAVHTNANWGSTYAVTANTKILTNQPFLQRTRQLVTERLARSAG